MVLHYISQVSSLSKSQGAISNVCRKYCLLTLWTINRLKACAKTSNKQLMACRSWLFYLNIVSFFSLDSFFNLYASNQMIMFAIL